MNAREAAALEARVAEMEAKLKALESARPTPAMMLVPEPPRESPRGLTFHRDPAERRGARMRRLARDYPNEMGFEPRARLLRRVTDGDFGGMSCGGMFGQCPEPVVGIRYGLREFEAGKPQRVEYRFCARHGSQHDKL